MRGSTRPRRVRYDRRLVAWVLGAVGLVAIELAALCMIPLGLPGTWLQVAVAGVLAWTDHVSARGLLAVAGLAIAGEIAEAASGHWGARRFGGSRRAAWGALVGGMAGLLIGSPIPVAGPLVASLVGTFAGAVVGEMWERGRLSPEMRVGVGAIVGRALGVGFKLGVALAIAAVSFSGFFGR